MPTFAPWQLSRPFRRTAFLPGVGSAAAFTPARLFAASEVGAWYDPSDLTTLFKDTAGTSPVTTAGDTVALMLDKSRQTSFEARRNLITYTDQFDNAVWNSANTGGTGVAPVVTANYATAPDGTMTAERIVFSLGGGTTSSDISRRRQVTVSGSVVGTGTFSFWAKATDGVSTFDIGVEDAGGFTTQRATVTGSWQRFSFTQAVYIVGSSVGVGLRGARTPALPNTADILIWGAQLEAGSTATTYQPVGASLPTSWLGNHATQATAAQRPTYRSSGGLSWLEFDGVDDGMVTGTITPGVDKVQVFAGLRKTSDAARGTIAELTVSAAANNGAWHLTAPNAASATMAFESKGTLLTDAVASSITAPATRVLAGLGDISGDSTILRVNGVQADADTGDQGTGNYASAALYLGRRGGSSLPFAGNLYGLIVRFSAANLDAASISSTETWLNAKTGAY